MFLGRQKVIIKVLLETITVRNESRHVTILEGIDQVDVLIS